VTLAVCADVGSTYTKVAVVDLDDGALVGAAAHPTTAATDVLHGLDAAVAAATDGLPAAAHTYVCSSAGGGLRLAVVGYEALVTAQAGQRVGLSAGARVVHVAAGRLDAARLAALRGMRPGRVLRVGGSNGGDADVLTHNATRLARARWRVPVVLAGNADVREPLTALLAGRGVPVTGTANVLPRIGVLDPRPARAAIREVFLRHVIGGKRLSRGTRFAGLVRAATPDAVLAGVEHLADHDPGDLLVVDVGGATTDVYSVLTPAENRDVAGALWRARTVEGDLGMRWNAPGVVRAAVAERLPVPDGLVRAAADRAAAPGLLPVSDVDRAVDARIATLATTVALRRHARAAAAGRDLRDVRLVVGSGGVLRHADADTAAAILGAALTDHAGGWALPRAPRVALDTDYVLAAGGLLAGDHPEAALRLLRTHLSGRLRSAGRQPSGR
jgi:uncharacterized protein (TIGR01319 family)